MNPQPQSWNKVNYQFFTWGKIGLSLLYDKGDLKHEGKRDFFFFFGKGGTTLNFYLFI